MSVGFGDSFSPLCGVNYREELRLSSEGKDEFGGQGIASPQASPTDIIRWRRGVPEG